MHVVSVVAQTTVPAEFFTRYDDVFAVAAHDKVTDSSPDVALENVGAEGTTAVVTDRDADAADVPAPLVVVATTLYVVP